jgi:large subunit ribosomal protein L32
MSHEPKKKHSTQRKGKRRASIKLAVAMASNCKNCGAVNLSHRVCAACGFYNGRQIVKVNTPTVVRRRRVADEA